MAKNPFSVSPSELKALEKTYKGRTTKPTDMRTFKVDAKPRAKPQPKLEVVPMPSVGSTARSVLGMLKGAPEGIADLAVSVPTAAYDYFRTSTPGEVASDVTSGLSRFADYVRNNPLEALAEMSPAGAAKDAGEMLREASLARDAGDEARAAQIEKFAVPMMLASVVPVGRAAKGAERVAAGAERAAAPAILSARSGTAKATAADVLAEAGRKGKKLSYADWRVKNPENGVILDMSRLSEVPNVPQTQLPRVVPPRGPSPRIVEALGRPEVEKGINETVERGIEGGGLQWYNTEPIRERMAPEGYSQLMDIMAATSPRSKVTDNVRTGSYYNYLRSQGIDIPNKPQAGYGSIAQNLHRDNVRDLVAHGGWDVFQHPKPASFSANLQGNQQVATIDTHNFRLPGILSGDPRFLETTVTEKPKDKTLQTAAELLARQYPGLPESVIGEAVRTTPKGDVAITYKPQRWVNEGYIPMSDALNDPALWTAKPNPNEYGYYEQWQQDQAKKMGISPAQYQASMWLGGGETTGLGSAAEPFVGTFEARVRYTADRLGLDPEKVLEQVLKGEIPLLAEGGSVGAKELAAKYA